MALTPDLIVQRVITRHTGVPVGTKEPRVIPDDFLRIDMGAPNRTSLDGADTLIIVQAYGLSKRPVIELLQRLSYVLEDELPLEPDVYGWDSLTMPHDFPDPDIDHIRWQFTGRLFHTLD